MHYGLLFRLSGAYSEMAIASMKQFLGELQGEDFLLGPPQLVDEVDESGRTRPDDQPIRTVGGYMIMYPPADDLDHDLDMAQLRDVEYLVEKLARFTRAESVSIELELGGVEVGTISAGVVSDSISRGLVGEWKRKLES